MGCAGAPKLETTCGFRRLQSSTRFVVSLCGQRSMASGRPAKLSSFSALKRKLNRGGEIGRSPGPRNLTSGAHRRGAPSDYGRLPRRRPPRRCRVVILCRAEAASRPKRRHDRGRRSHARLEPLPQRDARATGGRGAAALRSGRVPRRRRRRWRCAPRGAN